MMNLAPRRSILEPLKQAALILTFALGAGGVHAQAVQGVTDTEIVLGTQQDLSGPAAAYGVPHRDGQVLALEEINAAGGIHGRKIRLVAENHGMDPKRAVLSMQKMISQDKIFALIDPLGSATTMALMPVALERNVPILFPAAGTESVYLPLSPLKFGLLTSSATQARAGVRFAVEKLGKKRFGLLYQDDESGTGMAQAVEAQLKSHGITLVEKTSYKRGDTDFSAQIARLKAAKIELLMLNANVRETAGVAVESRKQNLDADIIASNGAQSPATLRLGGEAVEGMYITIQFVPPGVQEITPAQRAALDRYKARFGREAEDGTYYGYNAMMLFAEGARNAGRGLTPQTLQQGLEKVKDWKSVFAAPPVTYTATSHAPPTEAVIVQIKDGKYRIAATL